MMVQINNYKIGAHALFKNVHPYGVITFSSWASLSFQRHGQCEINKMSCDIRLPTMWYMYA